MFYLTNIKGSLIYHKVINLIVVITLTIGMLYPLGMATIIREIVIDRDLCRYDDVENHMIVDCFDTLTPLEEYRDKLSWLEVKGLEYGMITYYISTAYVGGGFRQVGFSSYTNEYLEQEGYRLVEGRLLTEEEHLNKYTSDQPLSSNARPINPSSASPSIENRISFPHVPDKV